MVKVRIEYNRIECIGAWACVSLGPNDFAMNYAVIEKNAKHVAAIAKALKEALDKNWGDIPRKQAEKFDWDMIAQKYEDLFKSL